MKKRPITFGLLFILVVLMFLASGLHGSYFCVSPWAGAGPLQESAAHARP
jgi:hypothetical protein